MLQSTTQRSAHNREHVRCGECNGETLHTGAAATVLSATSQARAMHAKVRLLLRLHPSRIDIMHKAQRNADGYDAQTLEQLNGHHV